MAMNEVSCLKLENAGYRGKDRENKDNTKETEANNT